MTDPANEAAHRTPNVAKTVTAVQFFRRLCITLREKESKRGAEQDWSQLGFLPCKCIGPSSYLSFFPSLF